MYSADSSHSSMVAAMPRLSSTGLRCRPSSLSSVKFCMFRAPTWNMSQYRSISVDLADVHDLGHELQIVLVRRGTQHPQALFAEPLEAVRANCAA